MRREDWAERLVELVEARRDTPFEWGSHDCALFAADCVVAMTGVDHAADFRGAYTSARGAMDALGQRGLDGLLDDIFPRIDPGFMQRGDICAVARDAAARAHELELALGVCLGLQVAVPGVDGLQFIPSRRALHAWRVE